MSVHIALVNESTVVADSELDAWAAALRQQIRHLQTAGWPALASVGHYKATTAPAGAQPMIIKDDSDVQGALGYHEVDAQGRPVGYVFARTALDAGIPPSSVVSHETVEQVLDELAAAGYDLSGDGSQGALWVALEGCDPVEDGAYGYSVTAHVAGSPVAVALSDFLLPAWFQQGAAGPFDWTKSCPAPLTLLPGGYAAVQVDGVWQQDVHQDADGPDGINRSSMSHRIGIRAARLGQSEVGTTGVPVLRQAEKAMVAASPDGEVA